MKTNILLVGGYHKTSSLAESLLLKGFHVTVINSDREDCERLAEIEDLDVIWGDGSKEFILKEADISRQQTVIAMTPQDEENFVICQICKKVYRTPKVVALVGDPGKTSFFYQMGIDRVVCAINAIIIEEQALMEKMTTMIPLTNGKIHILEVPILENAQALGRELRELPLPKDVIIGCVVRGEQSIIPGGDTRLKSGDVVILITTGEEQERAVQILSGSRERVQQA